MDRDEQSKGPEKPTLSPLAQDKTYGEKKFDLIFGNVLNFWVNLAVSAGFTFLVNHAERGPFKTLRDKQEKWTEILAKKSWVRTEGNPEESLRQAKSIVNVLTLLTPGHFVMIPSVWLGEKFKAPIVKYFDRKHYGAEAMENPDLKARHEAIALAEKPTFLGTVMGRAGGAVVNVAISRTIGSEENYINKAGEKYNNPSAAGFKGIDHTAEEVGSIGIEAVGKVMPRVTNFLNKKLSTGMGYSNKQISEWKAGTPGAVDTTQPYNKGLNDLSRYFVQDIMYTLSTAAFVKPIVMGLRHILPGMTYKGELKPEMDATRIEQIKRPPVSTLRVEAPLFAEAQPETTPEASDKPATRISHAHNESTITKHHQHTVHAG